MSIDTAREIKSLNHTLSRLVKAVEHSNQIELDRLRSFQAQYRFTFDNEIEEALGGLPDAQTEG